MSSVLVIADNEFQTQVLSETLPVLVYFWAPWCGPCRLMSPVIEKIAAQYGDRLKIVKMEVDPNPQTVAAYNVQGVPALLLFHTGQLLEMSEGAINQQKLESFLAPHLSQLA